MSFVSGLRRTWVSIELPGQEDGPGSGTYVEHPGELPRPPGDVADLSWLRRAPEVGDNTFAYPMGNQPVRDLTWQALLEMVDDPARLPDDFRTFVREPDLRRRIRSATYSYFDLGEETVPVEGGRLLHVVSDQQWVYHWLLFVGDDGTSAVVGTPEPLGFVEDEEAEAGEAVVLADSFSVFLWRWWMDNEAFFAASEGRDLTPEQRAYVTAYGPPHPLA